MASKEDRPASAYGERIQHFTAQATAKRRAPGKVRKRHEGLGTEEATV